MVAPLSGLRRSPSAWTTWQRCDRSTKWTPIFPVRPTVLSSGESRSAGVKPVTVGSPVFLQVTTPFSRMMKMREHSTQLWRIHPSPSFLTVHTDQNPNQVLVCVFLCLFSQFWRSFLGAPWTVWSQRSGAKRSCSEINTQYPSVKLPEVSGPSWTFIKIWTTGSETMLWFNSCDQMWPGWTCPSLCCPAGMMWAPSVCSWRNCRHSCSGVSVSVWLYVNVWVWMIFISFCMHFQLQQTFFTSWTSRSSPCIPSPLYPLPCWLWPHLAAGEAASKRHI